MLDAKFVTEDGTRRTASSIILGWEDCSGKSTPTSKQLDLPSGKEGSHTSAG